MQKVNRVRAVIDFLSKDSRKVEVPEMMNFWRNCTQVEKVEFSESAALQMGYELAPDPTAQTATTA